MVGAVVMVVVKGKMIVTETRSYGQLRLFCVYTYFQSCVYTRFIFVLPSWSFTFSTDHALYLDGFS